MLPLLLLMLPVPLAREEISVVSVSRFILLIFPIPKPVNILFRFAMLDVWKEVTQLPFRVQAVMFQSWDQFQLFHWRNAASRSMMGLEHLKYLEQLVGSGRMPSEHKLRRHVVDVTV